MVAGAGHGWQSGVVVLDRLTRISLRVGLRVLGVLATLAGLALVCQYQTGYPLRRTLHFPSALMRSEGGAAFSVSMSKFKNNYPWPVHRLSTVLESGKPLKIAASSSERVRESAMGAYAFSPKRIWIATSDASDPCTNGRDYSAVLPITISPSWFMAGRGPLVLGLAMVLWPLWLVLARGVRAAARSIFRLATNVREWLWRSWRRAMSQKASLFERFMVGAITSAAGGRPF